jgi:hypothetical protein
MLAASERACFVIADISGYTSYLSGTELDHAQDVLADLMELVIAHGQPILRLAKLEGDAVFTYAPEADIEGSMLLDVLETTYFAFRRRVRSIRQASTCRCNACVLIPNLNLKFCVHHGAFARQRIAGQEELAGRDVILVHRLLKNTVADHFGLQGYALLTAPCVELLHLDPEALGLRPHQEEYEHLGMVAAYVHDLEGRWQQEQEVRRVFLRPEDADVNLSVSLPGPPALAWEFMTAPQRFTQLDPGIRRDEQHAAGRRGVGSATHCVHGDGSSHLEEILDWRPFQYFTYVLKDPQMGPIRATVEFTPAHDGTQMRYSLRLEEPQMRAMIADPEQRLAFEEVRRQISAQYDAWFAALKTEVGALLASRQEELDSTAQARRTLQEHAAHYWSARENWTQAGAPP